MPTFIVLIFWPPPHPMNLLLIVSPFLAFWRVYSSSGHCSPFVSPRPSGSLPYSVLSIPLIGWICHFLASFFRARAGLPSPLLFFGLPLPQLPYPWLQRCIFTVECPAIRTLISYPLCLFVPLISLVFHKFVAVPTQPHPGRFPTLRQYLRGLSSTSSLLFYPAYFALSLLRLFFLACAKAFFLHSTHHSFSALISSPSLLVLACSRVKWVCHFLGLSSTAVF